MAAVVVLPEPLRPTSMMTVGGFEASLRVAGSPPRMLISSSLTMPTTICGPVTDFTTSWPRARSRTGGDELADDLEVDVGFEQGDADLAHGLVEVLFGDGAARAQLREDAG